MQTMTTTEYGFRVAIKLTGNQGIIFIGEYLPKHEARRLYSAKNDGELYLTCRPQWAL